jgi:hypothetical protein
VAIGLGCSPFQLFRVAWVWESDAASRGVCIGWPEPGSGLYCLFADLLLTPLAMHLTGACHWPRPSDCKTDANSSISGKRTPRVICIVYGVCVWSYLRGAEETDPHSPLRACGRNVWVGRILPLFSFLLVVPMVPIARVRRPFQWLVSIGVGYLRSVAWRIGGYKGVGLVVVLGPKDAQRVQMEPTGCYS